MGSWQKAALATTVGLVLFFSYGHIYNYLEAINSDGLLIGRHRYLAPVWLSLLLVSLRRVWVTSESKLQNINRSLNLLSAILLTVPLAQMGLFTLRNLEANASISTTVGAHLTPLETSAEEQLPDIYYIILDGYARDDILSKFYQLDNGGFLTSIRKMGFYVANCAQSNYSQTQLSLASSLNLNYLDSLGYGYNSANNSRVGLPTLIKHSLVRQALEHLGYKTIAFESGYAATEISDADNFLSSRTIQRINDFENLFIRTTAARVLAEGVAALNIKPDWEARDQAHRERVLYALEKLPEITTLQGPKFVFAHILSPHWPHVFGPNGEPVHEHQDSVSGYRNQVIFINKEIKPVLAGIIANSSTPPIIILQGDHGSIIESPVRRMSILNAYYLPDGDQQMLYENISPVNSFRLIFKHYFGGDYPLLADISYYSRYDEPFVFTAVGNERPGCP